MLQVKDLEVVIFLIIPMEAVELALQIITTIFIKVAFLGIQAAQ